MSARRPEGHERRDTSLVWTRLHLPRPLDQPRVEALLLALASDRRSPNLVFELRASTEGVSHLLGTSATAVQGIKRLLRDHVPGLATQAAPDRVAVSEVGRMELRPAQVPLRTDNATVVARALLSAVGVRLRQGETVAVQVVLGRRRPPLMLGPSHPSPRQSIWQLLTSGSQDASREELRQLRQRAEDAGFDATVRVGTHSPDPDRARRLSVTLHSALFTAKGPGVRIEFVHDNPRTLTEANLPRRWPLELSCAELVGLLGWPLGDDEYPGMPALHPKPLRPASAVETTHRTFARSLAPGDERQVGVSARDSLLHTIAYGPTNAGKSTVFLNLITADLQARRPGAVIDPKRQLVDDVLARVPKDRLDDLVVLDVSRDNPIGFNPLDVTGRDPDVVVDGILSVFGALFTDGWGPRTADIFSGTLRTLGRASAASGVPATLADIPRMLTDDGFRRRVVGQVPHDEGLASFWGWYESQSPQARQAAISSPLNKLRQLLLRPSLMRMVDQRDTKFRLRDIWRDNRVVLVPLNEALIGSGTAEMLGSLIVADLWQSVQERASERSPEKRPGFVVVDEAPRFLHLPTSMGDALALSRSMGVGWSLAAQFTRQFPKDLRSAVDHNARTKIVLGTEYEDAAHFARGSKDLKVEDFTSLGRFQAYANLVADGRPSGWSLVETLPPPPQVAKPAAVLRHVERRWATPAAPPEAPTTSSPARNALDGTQPERPVTSQAHPPPDPTAPPMPPMTVGRKRRQP